MSGVGLGGRESDLTIPKCGLAIMTTALTHRLLKVTFWRRARLSIGRKTLALAPLLRSITTRPRSIVSEWCGVCWMSHVSSCHVGPVVPVCPCLGNRGLGVLGSTCMRGREETESGVAWSSLERRLLA